MKFGREQKIEFGITVKANASMKGTYRFASLLCERYELFERLRQVFGSLTQGAPVVKHSIDGFRGLP